MMKTVVNKIENYLDLLRTHYDFDLKMSVWDGRILVETPFNQNWDLGINILFSSIYKKEEFYISLPSLHLSPTNDKINRFMNEMEVVTKIVNDLNNLIDEWRSNDE